MSPAPRLVSLRNQDVESYFSSRVPIPAALAMWHSCGTFISECSQRLGSLCLPAPAQLAAFKATPPCSLLFLSRWHVQPWNRLIPGRSRSADWISKLGRELLCGRQWGFFPLFAASWVGTEDSCSCISPKGLQNSQMPLPQSADSWGLSVVVCDSSCEQEQRRSCGEVSWKRRRVQLPALLQNLCDLISTGPSCAFSLTPELIAVSVHA